MQQSQVTLLADIMANAYPYIKKYQDKIIVVVAYCYSFIF